MNVCIGTSEIKQLALLNARSEKQIYANKERRNTNACKGAVSENHQNHCCSFKNTFKMKTDTNGKYDHNSLLIFNIKYYSKRKSKACINVKQKTLKLINSLIKKNWVNSSVKNY